MLDRDKIIKYLDFKIKIAEKEHEEDNKLSEDNPNKNMFVHVSARGLRELKELKAYIESGLANKEE